MMKSYPDQPVLLAKCQLINSYANVKNKNCSATVVQAVSPDTKSALIE